MNSPSVAHHLHCTIGMMMINFCKRLGLGLASEDGRLHLLNKAGFGACDILICELGWFLKEEELKSLLFTECGSGISGSLYMYSCLSVCSHLKERGKEIYF